MKTGLLFANLKVLVVGLAREGRAVARFLAEQGATVIVTDIKPAAALSGQIAALQGLDIRFHLGSYPEALLAPNQIDLLVVSPGVPLTIPFLQRAQEAGLPLTTETRLFCQLCPTPIVGISGSSGKTTTTTLVSLMLQEAGYTTHVGGNIGQPLITDLDQIRPSDRVVMELSSFQLEYFHPRSMPGEHAALNIRPFLSGWSPKVGALLNITPNHLDRHGTMTAYMQAKRSLVAYMDQNQTAVLGLDNPTTQQIGSDLSAPVHWFSLTQRVEQGACVIDNQITLVKNHHRIPICPIEAIKLRGRHNIYNVLAACTIANAAGATVEAMATVATSFTGVAHRLEKVATKNGVTYYNDSIATSPERLIAALKAFDEPLILLAGGKDKNLPWDEAAQLIVQRTKYLLLFGQAAELIGRAVQQVQSPGQILEVRQVDSLEAAIRQAQALAQAGDIVILSPGCTSYDAYADFVARGEHFRNLVLAA